MTLEQILGGSIYTFLMIFVRLGSAFMVMPGYGEQYVSPRIRLLFALAISFVLMPLLLPSMPAAPAQPADLVLLVIAEALIGVFLGTIARFMMSALETAGMLIANQVGLSAAQSFNPAMAQAGNAVTAVLSMLALMLIFATDLHHLLLLAVVDSYSLFPPGHWLPMGDVAQHVARVLGDSFQIGMQLAAPFIVIGLLFYLGLGLVARLVPQIQVFFVGVPIQIVLGLLLLSLSLTALMTFWLTRFEGQLVNILEP
jgi:flagellar biosynthesis protein FliR